MKRLSFTTPEKGKPASSSLLPLTLALAVHGGPSGIPV